MTGGAVVYVRVSSEEQVHGTSLETQEAACRACAARLSLRVLSVERDAGKSAKSTVGRDGLARAVAECRKHGAALVVYKFDRLARNAVDALSIRDALTVRGCRVYSATEGEATATPVARAMFGVASIFAELDNAIRAERSRGGMVARVAQGGWTHKAPVGYRNAKSADGVPILVPDEKTAVTVRSAFVGLADGSLDVSGAVRLLRGLGVSRSRAFAILQSPIYGGTIVGPLTVERAEVSAAFPGLVSKEIFDAARVRFVNRGGSVKMKDNPETPLIGSAYCATCGRALVGGFSTGRSGARFGYYRCPARCCSVSFKAAHDAVSGLFARLTACRPFLDLVRANLEEFSGQADEEEKATVQKARADVARYEARLTRARAALLDGVFRRDEYESARAETEAALAEARTVIVSHERWAARRSDAVTALVEVAAAPDRILALPRAPFRDLVRILFDRLEVTPDKKIEPRKGCVFQSLMEAEAEPSGLVDKARDFVNRLAESAGALVAIAGALRG